MATQQALLEGWDQPQDDVDVGENPSLHRSERECRPGPQKYQCSTGEKWQKSQKWPLVECMRDLN